MKRIVVDYTLCEANAMCMKIAPEVFHVDAEDNLHLLIESPAPELVTKVENAVRRCPRGALSLVDE
jgi:ferredoxin